MGEHSAADYSSSNLDPSFTAKRVARIIRQGVHSVTVVHEEGPAPLVSIATGVDVDTALHRAVRFQ